MANPRILHSRMPEGTRELMYEIAELQPAQLSRLRDDLHAYRKERDTERLVEIEQRVGAVLGRAPTPELLQRAVAAFTTVTGLVP